MIFVAGFSANNDDLGGSMAVGNRHISIRSDRTVTLDFEEEATTFLNCANPARILRIGFDLSL